MKRKVASIIFYCFGLLVVPVSLLLIYARVLVPKNNLQSSTFVMMTCCIAAYVKWRSSNIASTVEYVTNVLMALIIIVGGLITALVGRTTRVFSHLWYLLFSWYSWFVRLGIGVAAYSAVGDRNRCAGLLFHKSESF